MFWKSYCLDLFIWFVFSVTYMFKYKKRYIPCWLLLLPPKLTPPLQHQLSLALFFNVHGQTLIEKHIKRHITKNNAILRQLNKGQ